MTEWREGQAAQYDHYGGDHEKALAELDNLEAIYEELGNAKMAAETRGFAAGVRACLADLNARARDLRAPPPAATVMPIGLTTRRRPARFECGPDDIDESGGLA